jgi:hypothetical protein
LVEPPRIVAPEIPTPEIQHYIACILPSRLDKSRGPGEGQGLPKCQPTMKNDNRSQYVTRESVLMLLSDDEVSAVATAETATRLPDGDEYLDMEQLDQGVQRAHQKKTPMGRVLPKKSVREDTWQKILKQLPAHSGVKANVA